MQPEKSQTLSIFEQVLRALHRARISILAVALTYLLSVSIGMLMVQAGNVRAVNTRDRIVSRAQSGSTIIALKQNDRFRAALLDFGGNLYGAMATTIAGLGVITSFPIIVYRGWIGGIVSIDSSHVSRLADSKEAVYYLVTLILQLIPYTLSGGAGVNLGWAFLRPRPYYQGERWLGIPAEAIRDTFRIFLIVIPLFLVASLWEFFER